LNDHIFKQFDRELKTLKDKLLLMAAKVEERLADSVRCLVQRDQDLAKRTTESDRDINRLEMEVDELCVKIIALRQPAARDLRFITTALKIVTDLERCGDLAVNIAERAVELNSDEQLKPYIDLPKMSEATQAMLKDALDAFVNGDADKANSVLERDGKVDELFVQIFRELITYMMQDPRTIQRAIGLIFVAKHLERVADHATNIAEQAIYLAKGKDVRHVHTT
jgi:phosphate transport system protein